MNNKFTKGKNDNTIYCTSLCSNRCIMCCQPPSVTDDSKMLSHENFDLISNADSDTDFITITGGEPTLVEDMLFNYINSIWTRMPNACIQLLSNGRRFANVEFITKFAKNVKGNIYVGVPLHSDNAYDHDYISGAKNSFYETINGIQNLNTLGYEIELRVIIIKQNYKRLENIAEFIVHNLPFVGQVSFMGLEITGCAVDNYQDIWIDPIECNSYLRSAIHILKLCRISSKIFNIPMCLLSRDLYPYSCKSISDWKKTNLDICEKCSMINECCGLFSTSKYYSSNIRSI